MLGDLMNFQNQIIKVGEIKYSFDLGDSPQSSWFKGLFFISV